MTIPTYNFAVGKFHMTSQVWRKKKWLIESCNLCWKVIGRIPALGVILNTNKKLIKYWKELLLVSYSETKKLNQK